MNLPPPTLHLTPARLTLTLVLEHLRRASPELPRGHFSWLKPFLKTQATFVLNNGSLDGFLLLRYLKVLRNMCLVGCAVTWPVLLPLHATGGNGCTELEMLTMANVKNPQKFYTHVFISWIYFGACIPDLILTLSLQSPLIIIAPFSLFPWYLLLSMTGMAYLWLQVSSSTLS